MTRTALAMVLAAAFGLPALLTAVGQQDAGRVEVQQKQIKKRAVKGRLPAYYGQVVDAAQRQRIYQIQANYNPQIDALRAQIDALMAKRDAEIRGVLSPAQQQRLDALVAGAQAARAAKAAKNKKANKKDENQQ